MRGRLRELRRDVKLMSQVGSTAHYELFKAVFRKENDPTDAARVKRVLDYVVGQGDVMAKFLETQELRLMGLVRDHYRQFKQGVSREALGEIVHRQDKSDGMTSILKAYDDWVPTFKSTYDEVSTMSLMHRCLDEHRDEMFINYMTIARQIVTGGVIGDDYKKKGEPDKVGLQAALAFLMEQMQSPLFSNVRSGAGGWVKDIAPHLGKVYDRDRARAENDELVIPTGIELFDKVLGGLERRTLNFILGAAGARKSGLARTMAYNAAARGQRVLFIPTEFSYKEELQVFAAMHVNNAQYFTGIVPGQFTVDKIHGARLAEEDEAFLKNQVIPDMGYNLGDKLAIIQPASFTWSSIRSIIEMQNAKYPLDLIVLDYLGCLDIGDARDSRVAYNKMSKDVKDFLLYDLHNTSGGAAMISPCHASRKGIDDARAAEGNYVKEAISEYSQFEKSADVIMFAYTDPALEAKNMMKIGTCKSRRSADIPAQMVPVDPTTHRVGDAGVKSL